MDVLNLHDDPHIANILAYDDKKESLEQEHWGKWVVIHKKELLGAYGSFDEAQQAAKDAGINHLECCIRQVGIEPMPIILLGT